MIIKQSKGQTFLYFLFCAFLVVLFFCMGVFDLQEAFEDDLKLFGFPVFYWFIKILSIVLCAVMAALDIYFGSQLFSQKPLIEICDGYFFDNSSAISMGKILWEDMQGAYIGGGYLNIKLKDPEKYLKRMNKIQIFLIRSNRKMGYGDVCISAQRFKKNHAEFLEAFSAKMTIVK